eukprot:3989745-Heterocapsa_arctica.AAC.1
MGTTHLCIRVTTALRAGTCLVSPSPGGHLTSCGAAFLALERNPRLHAFRPGHPLRIRFGTARPFGRGVLSRASTCTRKLRVQG